MARPKGTTTRTAVFMLLKATIPKPTVTGDRLFPQDIDKAIGKYREFFTSLCLEDLWVKKTILLEAFTDFDNLHGLSNSISGCKTEWRRREAYQVKQALSRCRYLSARITSGKKLNGGIASIVTSFKKRKLRRKVSNESGCSDRCKKTVAANMMQPIQSEAGSTKQPMPAASTSDNLAQIWKLYGQHEPAVDAVVISDSDSDEATEGEASIGDAAVIASEAAPEKAACRASNVVFYDAHSGCVTRLLEDGNREIAKQTVAGKNGFVIGVFEDTIVETDAPNLMLPDKLWEVGAGTAADKCEAKAAKPKAKAKAAKPASVGQKRGVATDKTGKTLTNDERVALKPSGCSRCRNTAGCTPSCWKLLDASQLSTKVEG